MRVPQKILGSRIDYLLEKSLMRKLIDRIYPIIVIAAGLAATLAVSSVFVHQSNLRLYDKINAVKDAGFLIVPNERVLPSLLEWNTAIIGGLFFVFSIGAGLAVLTLTIIWIWKRFLNSSKKYALWVGSLWAVAATVAAVAQQSFILACFLVVTPAVTAIAALLLIPENGRAKRSGWAAFLLPVLIVGGFWSFQIDRNTFINIRDFVLWSNPVLSTVCDIYYEYTLYPAESFKPLSHKTIKTVYLNDDGKDAVRKALIRKDYLPIKSEQQAEVVVNATGGKVTLHDKRGATAGIGETEFIMNPGPALDDFSKKTDGMKILRKITFYSLLAGMPLMLYIFVFHLFRGVVFFLPDGRASILSGLLCLAVGFGLLIPINIGRTTEKNWTVITELIDSDSWMDRTAGFREIDEWNLEIGEHPQYRSHMDSPHTPERYHLARALGKSRMADTYNDLLIMVDDPQPNVRCAALAALADRRNTAAVKKVREILTTSDQWYVQGYAYHTLRRLGWSQEK